MSKNQSCSLLVSDLLQKNKGRSNAYVTKDHRCAVIDHSPLAAGENALNILGLELN